MTSEFIGLGLTVDPSKLPQDFTEAQTRLEPFKDSILDHIESVDPAGYFDAIDANDEDGNPDWEAVRDTIADGLDWLGGAEDIAMTFSVPETDYSFVTFGGETFGDSPFEQFDAVILAGNAADHVPGLAQATGIVGGGIRISYPEGL